MQKLFSSRSRLEKIVSDIVFDMETRPRLSSGRGNALLVSGSIYQACKYFELFQQTPLAGRCAIVTSYVPSKNDLKGESTADESEQTETIEQYKIYEKMLAGKSAEDFEKAVKKLFIDEPGQMRLLIVVDKLLTGFDAPSATYLYIDKKMQDHGLFQAICRVNRLDGEDKTYGFIIDYKDLFKSLESAIDDYTSEAFSNYDKTDIDGLIENRFVAQRKDLDDSLEDLAVLFDAVRPPADEEACADFLIGPDAESEYQRKKRTIFYQMVGRLVRSFGELTGEMDRAGYSPAEAAAIKTRVDFFSKLREAVKTLRWSQNDGHKITLFEERVFKIARGLVIDARM